MTWCISISHIKISGPHRIYVPLRRLPSISLLNGSVVTDSEREDAERFFIRYHFDYPEEELPYRCTLFVKSYTIVLVFVWCISLQCKGWQHSLLFSWRYHCLVTKYGKLEPLAEIDLRPRCRAQVEVHCEEKVEQVSSSVSDVLFRRVCECAITWEAGPKVVSCYLLYSYLTLLSCRIHWNTNPTLDYSCILIL